MANSASLSEYSLSCFRTKLCNNYINGNCLFTESRCIYSHNEICTRRCPYYLSDISFIRYIPVLCRDVVFGQNLEAIKSNCIHGNECIYAHCLDELLYHPQFYKIIACKNYEQGNCKHAFCPFVHKKSEQRTLKHYKLPFTRGMQVPPIKYITMVDKIGKIKPDAESLVKKKHSSAKSFGFTRLECLKKNDALSVVRNLKTDKPNCPYIMNPSSNTGTKLSVSTTLDDTFVKLNSDEFTEESREMLYNTVKHLLDDDKNDDNGSKYHINEKEANLFQFSWSNINDENARCTMNNDLFSIDMTIF